MRRYLLNAVRGEGGHADDLTHEVFLQVWRTYAPRLAVMDDEDVQRVLITTAKNRLIDLWRKDSKLVFFAGFDDTHLPLDTAAGAAAAPFDRIIDDELVARFARVAVKRLTDGEYRVAFMGWVMGYTDSEIAEALGTTTKTVKTHRWSARKKIKLFACKDGGEITFYDADDTTAPGIDGVRI
ncbi:RNA polymerase sigma factor [Nocardia carnea]|uniref:RNA polymerase sigma factor n=1 Tax=Nocardia carnea TaxID=37328 RepID=UPI0020D0B4D6|nr:sigma-70 family RNA polymerase sigma factor [Nocardia carnea]